jgi:hypothetical protein
VFMWVKPRLALCKRRATPFTIPGQVFSLLLVPVTCWSCCKTGEELEVSGTAGFVILQSGRCTAATDPETGLLRQKI